MMSGRHLLLSVAFALLLVSVAAPGAEPALVIKTDSADLEWGPCPEFIPAGCEIAVLHGDPAKPNVDIFFKVPGDFTIPLHRHTSAERMVLVSGELHVTYDGQEKQIVETGAYAFGPAERPHDAYCAPGDPCVLFIAFEAPLDAFPMSP